ncbi:hypothetical protein BCR42DRAFT_39109 [Absidia repens]|uniref:Uncharacterized protein n=1 Tax=Absidia repens TaxID=90262 RepID=A0A1X2IHG3_9FUNG|nr:hypothetical protein BCR42DRAFT_39109 [Absidia repens]
MGSISSTTLSLEHSLQDAHLITKRDFHLRHHLHNHAHNGSFYFYFSFFGSCPIFQFSFSPFFFFFNALMDDILFDGVSVTVSDFFATWLPPPVLFY